MSQLEKEYERLVTLEAKRISEKESLSEFAERINLTEGGIGNYTKKYDKLYSQICDLIILAENQEKAGDFNKAIDFYVRATNLAEPIDEIRLPRYAKAYERLFILYTKTNQISEEIDLLRFLVDKYKNWTHPSFKKWVARLEKKEASFKPKPNIEIQESDICIPETSVPTFGERLEIAYNEMPKFDFYYNKPPEKETFEYVRDVIIPNFPEELEKWQLQIIYIKRAYNNVLAIADAAEKTKNYKKAIETYEELISEGIPNLTPYKQLLKIYRTLDWHQREIQIAKIAVDFFREIRNKQFEYVLALSTEFNSQEKAMDYVNNKKKIQYYGGLFEIYNPYPIVEELEEAYQI